MKASVSHISVWRTPEFQRADDLLAVEEPLQLRLEHGPEEDRQSTDLTVTMRTPGHDFELAVGFLFSEGIIRRASDVLKVRYCEQVDRPEERENVVRLSLDPGLQVDIAKLRRNFFTTSSCGVCGKQSVEQVIQACSRIG